MPGNSEERSLARSSSRATGLAAPMVIAIATTPAVQGQEVVVDTMTALEESGTCLIEDTRAYVTEWPSVGYAMVTRVPTATISVFDEEGACIGLLGEEGDGPGEFRRVLGIVSGGDSLYVSDLGTGRLSVFGSMGEEPRTAFFDPPALRPVRYIPVGSSQFVVNQEIRTPEFSGYKFFLMDGEGGVAEAFGEESPYVASESDMFRLLRPIPSTRRFWAIKRPNVVEEWNADGERISTFEPREPPWLRESPGDVAFDDGEPPDPTLRSVWRDDRGHLWLLAWVADARWNDGLAIEKSGNGDEEVVGVNNFNQVYDSVVLVYDEQEGSLIASERVDGYLNWVRSTRDPTQFAAVREQSRGRYVVEIISFRLSH